ncbi:methyltransferase [Methylophaga nitratireducenticrescens]|uniref:Small RNA 2'-O-methyltransferase n=1 Tax=Methylophaga nitratireducenticrescens TaxID=754476 RepID=I1XF41_METNJ|nr:methyltransferase [Methylophaga nitratireducenticrescens]AFI83010.1 methyltransferase type 12 [Methylophaga nitratireducenticrescens]AUZ83188.1 methyltransferase type 12 [Methylophaga nitratireducenticrescens]
MFPNQDTQISDLHEVRHQHILKLVQQSGVKQLLDIGCGSGNFLWQLLNETPIEQVIGVEQSSLSILQAREKLAVYLQQTPSQLKLINASYAEPLPELCHFPLAVMIETIEHIEPRLLSKVEQNIFAVMRPKQIILTTPNCEYNPLYGLYPGQFRDPDHQFEWTRQKFQQWARGVAARHDYQVRFAGIGEADPQLGSPTQMAIFNRAY